MIFEGSSVVVDACSVNHKPVLEIDQLDAGSEGCVYTSKGKTFYRCVWMEG